MNEIEKDTFEEPTPEYLERKQQFKSELFSAIERVFKSSYDTMRGYTYLLRLNSKMLHLAEELSEKGSDKVCYPALSSRKEV